MTDATTTDDFDHVIRNMRWRDLNQIGRHISDAVLEWRDSDPEHRERLGPDYFAELLLDYAESK